MCSNPPAGVTPPAPGLEREEPEFVVEEDIPKDESDRPGADAGEEAGGPHNVERE